MKILFITPFFYPIRGGMEEQVLQISKELIKRDHEITVFTSNLSRKGKIKIKEEIYEGIKIKRFNALFKLGNFASFIPKIFTANKDKFDIIHIHGYRHPTNLIPLFTKKPCFITLHYPNYPKGLRNKLNDIVIPLFDKTIGKYLLKKYKKLIAINPLELIWIKKIFKTANNKLSLIHNGIPKEYLKQTNGELFRKQYNIKKNEFIVFNLSRIHKSKGQDLILKAAKSFPKTKFIIAGQDSGYLSYLQSLKEKLKLNNVIFIENLPEKLKLSAYNSSDIFLFPSHYEGFGIVILEAFSQKSCVLSSDAGPLPYVINNAGLLFNDNNLKDLKEKLSSLIKNKKLRNNYKKLGYKRAENFTWDKIVNKLEKEYNSFNK